MHGLHTANFPPLTWLTVPPVIRIQQLILNTMPRCGNTNPEGNVSPPFGGRMGGSRNTFCLGDDLIKFKN